MSRSELRIGQEFTTKDGRMVTINCFVRERRKSDDHQKGTSLRMQQLGMVPCVFEEATHVYGEHEGVSVLTPITRLMGN